MSSESGWRSDSGLSWRRGVAADRRTLRRRAASLCRCAPAVAAAHGSRHRRFLRRRAHALDEDWSMPFPFARRHRRRARRLRDIDGNEYADFCLGDTGSMFGHSPAPVAAGHRAPGRQGPDVHAADGGCDRGGTAARRAFRPAALADRNDRDRRQPLRAARGARRDGTPEDPGLQRLLPRHGRRDVRAARRTAGPSIAPASLGQTRRPHPTRTRRRIQRRRRAANRHWPMATSPA